MWRVAVVAGTRRRPIGTTGASALVWRRASMSKPSLDQRTPKDGRRSRSQRGRRGMLRCASRIANQGAGSGGVAGGTGGRRPTCRTGEVVTREGFRLVRGVDSGRHRAWFLRTSRLVVGPGPGPRRRNVRPPVRGEATSGPVMDFDGPAADGPPVGVARVSGRGRIEHCRTTPWPRLPTRAWSSRAQFERLGRNTSSPSPQGETRPQW